MKLAVPSVQRGRNFRVRRDRPKGAIANFNIRPIQCTNRQCAIHRKVHFISNPFVSELFLPLLSLRSLRLCGFLMIQMLPDLILLVPEASLPAVEICSETSAAGYIRCANATL